MPAIDAIDAAMRDPSRSVPAIARLGGGTLAVDGAGNLWRVAGRSSVIYALRRPDGRIAALRVPLADGATATRYAERYRDAAEALALAPLRSGHGTLPADLHVSATGITLDDPGHRAHGHPVIATEYLPGGTLGLAARAAAESRDISALEDLFDSLTAMLSANDAVGFDHGALGPETILLRDDRSMATPNLATAAWPGAVFRAGTAPRPGRDRLPALLLLTELAALIHDPAMLLPEADWQHLVLTPDDLTRPGRSRTLANVIDYATPSASALAMLARNAIASGDPPRLSRTLDAARSRLTATDHDPRELALTPPPERWRPTPASPRDGAASTWPSVMDPAPESPDGWQKPTRPAAGAVGHSHDANQAIPVNPWDEPARLPAPASQPRRLAEIERLNALLMAGELDAAARLWTEAGLASDPGLLFDLDARTRALLDRRALEIGATPPPEPTFRPPATPGVDALRAALDASDAERIAILWPQHRSDPAAALLAHRVDAVLTRDLATRAGIAARRHDAAALAAIDQEATSRGIALPPETRRAIRATRRAAAARDALAAAHRVNDHAAIADLSRSGLFDDTHDGKSSHALPAELARARDRALAWESLERALLGGDDGTIVDAWNRDLLDADPALTQERRARINLAEHRLWWLQSARAALRSRDSAAARRLLREIPPGVETRLGPVERRRLDRLARAGAAVTRLEIALQTGPDAAVLDALAAVEASGQPLPDALDWAAIRGVADRVTLAAALREAAAAVPPDFRRIARLLPAARSAMGAGLTGDDAREFAALERSLFRAAAAGRIREAIASGDPAAIRTATEPDPYGALALLTTQERERVTQAFR